MMRKMLRLIYDCPNFLGQCIAGIFKQNDSQIAAFVRKKIYNTACIIDANVTIKNRRNFKAGKNSALYYSCYILNTFGNVSIGVNSHLGAFCYVNACYGKVTIGDDVAIGPGTKIFAYSNHYKKGQKVTDEKIVRNIVIGNNVFIGSNCSILPGSVIGDNVVVGAGAVVKGELKPNAIYGGIPCKKIKNSWYE